MRALKTSSRFYIFWFLVLAGCTTSTYHVLNQGNHGTDLNVSPDRILLECEWLHDADIEGLYGFMIHVLDEENTVLTLVQGNTLDKQTCEKRIHKIGNILAKGKRIYIAATGDLSDSRKNGKSYIFPKIGAFHSNGRVLGFAAIANEHGACYDAYSADEKPCPREPFPIKNKN